jgi:hypothetical protein
LVDQPAICGLRSLNMREVFSDNTKPQTPSIPVQTCTKKAAPIGAALKIYHHQD